MLIGSTRVALNWRAFDSFSAAELYEMLRLRQAIFVVEQHSPYADLDGLDVRAWHLLLHADGQLGGYLRLVPFPGEARVAIGRIAVRAELRGRGFARELMTAALARCRSEPPGGRITLSAQLYLKPFYERLGFQAKTAPYDDCGVPHIDMERIGCC